MRLGLHVLEEYGAANPGGPSMWCNTQVTYSPSPDNARSESELETNPLNPLNVVGASKRFIDPKTYHFTLAAYASFDGGESWTEAPPLALLDDPDPNKKWSGISDPVIAWDGAGNCYLVALPFPRDASPFVTVGIAVYRSTDGGLTWSAPNFIHPNTARTDDKQWAASDRNRRSRYFGNVYIAWDDGSNLAFARTTDRGTTWRGFGTHPVGAALASDSFAPSIAVTDDGSIFIFWIAGGTIKFVKSTDGGESFSSPAVVATGLTTLSVLPKPGGFPEFPGGRFRVLTLPTACAGSGQRVLVAWADFRDGVSRIYYRRTTDGGATWQGPASGQALLAPSVASRPNQQDFHPQLASRPGGEIACCFYEFGPKWPGGPPWIDVIIATSHDGGATFAERETVTNVPWDPELDAPLSHGDVRTTFIGDYFGLVGSDRGFLPFWTDTRTGIQEIFCGRKMTVGPWVGVQFRGRIGAHQKQRWFTFNWPACWHVAWTVVPINPRLGAPQVRWRVQVERASSGYITYWISITNLTDAAAEVEARYAIFARD
jgi:BNR/Asp-box repeat